MTAITPVVDLVVDANLVLIVAYCLWWMAQTCLKRSPLRADHGLQLRLMRWVLCLVIASPVLSTAILWLSQTLWPAAPLRISDMAIAAYLRGDIAMPAVEFEALLKGRGQIMEQVLAGQLPWLSWGLAAMLAGSAALMAQTAVAALRLRRIVQGSYVWRRTAFTDIRLSDAVTVPFATRGLWRRHVVLPTDLIARPAQLKIVLAHEFEHIRRRDVEWELAFQLLRPILYFNPAFHLWQRSFLRLRELHCDQAVMRDLKLSPRAYAQCLLDFCGPVPARRGLSRLNVALIPTRSRSARQALEARLMALTPATPMRAPRAAFAGILLVLATGVVLAAASVRTQSDWSQDRLMLSTIVNLERLEAINRGGVARTAW